MDDYKFALILDSGEIKRFGDSKSEDYHVACMLDAARDMYPDSKAPTISYWTASMRVVYRKKTGIPLLQDTASSILNNPAHPLP